MMRYASKGFTLIELIIVTVIVSVLASIAAPIMQGMKIKANLTEMYTTVSAIAANEHGYFLKYGKYAVYGDSDSLPLGWTSPSDPNNSNNIGFRDILGVDVIQKANSDFSYMAQANDEGRILVMRTSTWKGLCYYKCSTRTWHYYNWAGGDEWQKYIQYELLPP